MRIKMALLMMLLILACHFLLAGSVHRGQFESDFTVHNLYWNSSNPIFDIHDKKINSEQKEETATLNVRMMDSLRIHCPYYTTEEFKDLAEKSLLYSVSKFGFENCVLNRFAHVVGECDHPSVTGHVIHRNFRRRSPVFGHLSPGADIYLISTSSGTAEGLYQRRGGLCSQKNMRIKIHILKDSFDTARPIEIQSVFSEEDDNDMPKSKPPFSGNELFMTEEFNELIWKKKLVDPRIPDSEKKIGSKIIRTLYGKGARNEYERFAKTRQVERPIAAVGLEDLPLHLSKERRQRNEEMGPVRLVDYGELDDGENRSKSFPTRVAQQPYSTLYEQTWHSARKLSDGEDQPNALIRKVHTVHAFDRPRSRTHHRKRARQFMDENKITLMFYDKPVESIATPRRSSAFKTVVSPTTISLLLLYALR